MLNAEFKLLCESLGFYNARSVQQYLNRFPEHATLNERPVQTWLNGKKFSPERIPEDIVATFLKLQNIQSQIVATEREKLLKGENSNFKYLFKNEMYMWHLYPVLADLNVPVTFLNQIAIRLGLRLDYYENHELATD